MEPHRLVDLTLVTPLSCCLRRGRQRRDYRAAVALDRRVVFTIFEGAQAPLLLEMLDRL